MTTEATEHRFDRDTAVTPIGGGVYTTVPSAEWNAPAGPNGGYVAALLARAVLAEVADHERALRSFTAQFVRPPRTGEELRIIVTVDRAGRTVTNLSVRAEQADGKLVAMGIAIAGTDQVGALDYAGTSPAMPDPADVPTLPVLAQMPPISARYLMKPCLGPPPFSGGDEALSGGWIRLTEPRPFDALAAVAYLDAWLPAPFTRLHGPAAAPTLDYTVYLHGPLPPADLSPEAFLKLRIASTTSTRGYFSEDCEVWTPDGVLLAQSRQLALLAPLDRGPR